MRKGDGQMASKDGFLPVEFSDLERFAPDWVFETEHTGNAFRVEQSMADLDDYYHTVFPRTKALYTRIQFNLISLKPAFAPERSIF